jgi:hypothetical protein
MSLDLVFGRTRLDSKVVFLSLRPPSRYRLFFRSQPDLNWSLIDHRKGSRVSQDDYHSNFDIKIDSPA